MNSDYAKVLLTGDTPTCYDCIQPAAGKCTGFVFNNEQAANCKLFKVDMTDELYKACHKK